MFFLFVVSPCFKYLFLLASLGQNGLWCGLITRSLTNLGAYHSETKRARGLRTPKRRVPRQRRVHCETKSGCLRVISVLVCRFSQTETRHMDGLRRVGNTKMGWPWLKCGFFWGQSQSHSVSPESLPPPGRAWIKLLPASGELKMSSGESVVGVLEVSYLGIWVKFKPPGNRRL